jgi:hypothetical protein
VLLSGYEVFPSRGSKCNAPIYPQTWWCILRGAPPLREASPAESRARERVRQAQEIGWSMSIHPSWR